jgi:hypothetical protein
MMEVDNGLFREVAHDFGQPVTPETAEQNDMDKAISSGIALPCATDQTRLAPTPVSLHLHDDSVNCPCPSDAPRLAKDMVMTINGDSTFSWTHLPCKPLAAEKTGGQGINLSQAGAIRLNVEPKVDGDDVGDGGSVGKDPTEMFAGFIGPVASPEQRQKVKNFTSTFRCDGPCPGDSRTLSDFSLCKKCMSWQHKGCQLYGDPRDRGGPVCNQCYIDYVVHHDQIEKWQRRQLLRAVQAAVKYLKDPDTMHQTWRRKWCRDLVQGFFAKVC